MNMLMTCLLPSGWNHCSTSEELPQTAVDELIAAVNALNDKYSTTYSDVCEQIEQAEAELGNMLGQLTGNEFDMAGIAELKTLLGGE